MEEVTKILDCPHSPSDEDCKVMMCGLLFVHIQSTLKLTEVSSKYASFFCVGKFCLRQRQAREEEPCNCGKQVGKSYSSYSTLIMTHIRM